MNSKGGITKTLFELAYNRRFAAIEGSWFGAWGLEAMLWNVLVFRKIRSALGGRVRGMLSGGAPLSGDTQRFMNICFGYNLLVQLLLFINFQNISSNAFLVATPSRFVSHNWMVVLHVSSCSRPCE